MDGAHTAGGRQGGCRIHTFQADAIWDVEIVIPVDALSKRGGAGQQHQKGNKGELFHFLYQILSKLGSLCKVTRRAVSGFGALLR